MAKPTLWRVLVPVVCLALGLGLAMTYRTARGTNLRSSGTSSLVDLVHTAQQRVQQQTTTVHELQAQVDALTAEAARTNADVAAARSRAAQLLAPSGLNAVSGAGLTVVLDDAASSSANAGVDPNQLVVHQSDMQSVVNALWAGGAEAMSVAGQRLIATSAVRCVGNTLLLNGEVFSPPFRIEAIGPANAMKQQLDESPGVRLFKQAAEYYGLGYTISGDANLTVPAYAAPPVLSYARPLAK